MNVGRRRDAEVLVVGAGTSGSVLAAELHRRGVDVVVLDAGRCEPAPPWWSLQGAFDPATSDGTEVRLAGGRTLVTRRGLGVGGSAAINGCYWVRGLPSDHADWVAAAGDARWSHDRVDAAADALEHDVDVPTRRQGPIPVARDLDLEPVSEAFAAAGTALGVPWVADLNAGAARGVGPVPFNVRDGARSDPAAALGLRDDAPSGVGRRLELGTHATRLLVDAGRVTGVEAVGPTGARTWRSDRVVCCAGAWGTARLLFASGIGPAALLERSGRRVVADLPVGVAAWDHPSIDLPYLPNPGTAGGDPASFMQLALHVDDPGVGGTVEVMATRRPYGVVTGDDPDDRWLALRVTLMRPRSRVVVEPAAGDDPLVRYGTLDPDGDLAGLCAAVGFASDVAHGAEFAPVVAQWGGPGADALADAGRLSSWVAERVGTAYHLGGTAAMGEPGSAAAVVDAQLQVLGVDGLFVADTSVLPTPLRRGPAATAAVLGAMAATSLCAAPR